MHCACLLSKTEKKKLINQKTYEYDYLSWPLHHEVRSNTNHSDTKRNPKHEISTHFHNLNTMDLVIIMSTY